METQENKKKQSEEFLLKLVQILNHGALSLMISIGHRTGLFKTLENLGPASLKKITQASGLKQRYVQEWLGAMVVGGIIEYDSQKDNYYLDPVRAELLTSTTSPENLAATMQFIPVLAQVEDKIVECFKKGGGVPYESFNRFQEVMSQESDQTVMPALLDSIIPLVPKMKEKLQQGVEVLDVGCGSGHALNLLAKNFPKSHFKGYDFSEEGVRLAQSQSKEAGLHNLAFEKKDIEQLKDKDRFDLITAFDCIHDQAHPDKVLKNIAQALRPDGVFLMQDIHASSQLENNKSHPLAPFLYTVSAMHCMTVSLAQHGIGLGTVWGEEKACQMLKEAGFDKIQVHQLPHDILNSYFVAQKH